MTVLLTAGTSVALIGLIVVTGLLVARVIDAGSTSRREDWLDGPFLGLSVITLTLQNGVYAGIPVRISAWLLLAVVMMGVAALWWRGALKSLPGSCPTSVFSVALGVYALHGVGLWVVGIEAYAGRAWSDQINYSAIAHYLTDYVYGTHPPSYQPAAVLGEAYAGGRIGQSLLLAFFSTVLGSGIKPIFEPTILLLPFLVTLAVSEYGTQAGLPRWLALLLATLSGCLPAVAVVHLESFLSQALAIPGLLYLPVLLARAVERGNFTEYVRAGLVLSGTTAIYLEYLPFLAVCAVTFGIVGSFRLAGRWKHALGMSLVLLLPWPLQATRGLAFVVDAVRGPILAHIYPWAFSVEGIARLWAGDLVGNMIDEKSISTRAIALGLLVIGYFGLARQVSVELSTLSRDRGRLPALARSLCMLGLATAPWAILIWDDRYTYHFYKTLLMAAPLIAWGAGYALWVDLAWAPPWLRRATVVCGIGACGAVVFAATLDMVRASADAGLPEAERTRRRQSTQVMLGPGFVQMQRELERLSDRDIVLCPSDSVWSAGHVNGWFALFARRNRVWALNPRLNDQQLPLLAGEHYLQDAPAAAAEPVLVTTSTGVVWASPPNHRRLAPSVAVGPYQLLQPGTKAVAFLCNPLLSPTPDGAGSMFLRLPGERLIAFSTTPAKAALFLKLDGTVDPSSRLRVSIDGEPVSGFAHPSGIMGIPVSLVPGTTTIELTPVLEAPAALPVQMSLSLAQQDLRIASVSNANGLENVNGKRFFWIGSATTTLDVFAPTAGECLLELDTILGPSVTRTALRRLRVSAENGPAKTVETYGGRLSVRLPISAGWVRIAIEPLDKADTIQSHDPRPLILGVQDVRAALEVAR